MVWAGIAVLVTFWTGLALATQEGRTPESVRYVYASAAVCFLIAATCLAGRRVATKWLVVLFAVTALAMSGNLARLREGTNFFRDFATTFRVKLTAIEVARGVVPPNFQVATLPSLRAGAYLASVERNGSPAYTQSGLAEQPEPKRETADQELAAAEGLALTPAPPGPPKGCRPIAAGAPIRPPGVLLRSRSPASVLLARFADTPTALVNGTLQPRRPAALEIPADASSLPWRLGTNPPNARLLACRLPGG